MLADEVSLLPKLSVTCMGGSVEFVDAVSGPVAPFPWSEGEAFTGEFSGTANGFAGGAAVALTKAHDPVTTPRSSFAKKLNRPRERSRPPNGHPGH